MDRDNYKEKDHQPNYYAIIPANVRYDKTLPMGARLLYGEITALCNAKGYCWATNNYFAELYSVSKRTITSWISSLTDKGYINNELIYGENGKTIDRRYLTINNTPIEEIFHRGYRRKLPQGIEENFHTPIEEIFQENNTSFNNTNNSSAKGKKTPFELQTQILDNFEKMWKLYPNKKGKGKINYYTKENIYKLGDEFIKCIDRYKDYVEIERRKGFDLNYQNGSTFFNTGYLDYLDANYEEVKDDKKSKSNDPYAGMEIVE